MSGELGPLPYHGETLKQQGNFLRTEEDKDSNLAVDFDRLIEIKRQLETQEKMTEEELDRRLAVVEIEDRLDSVYRAILDRVRRETNYLHDFEQLGLLDSILEHALDKKTLAGVNVKWNDPSPRGKGVYRPIFNKAVTKHSIPTEHEIIRSLGVKGYLPPGLRTMGHEIVHARQNLNSKDTRLRLKSLSQIFSTKPASGELMEVHANRDANNPPQKKTKTNLVQKIYESTDAAGNKMYEGFDLDKLMYAVQAIDQLNALGLDPEEIARLIRPGLFSRDSGWDKETAAYPHIQKRIDEESKRLGLDEYDLENLVQADKLEREIEQMRVMRIVQEETENPPKNASQ